MSLPPDALAATLPRHIDLSNNRRRTLVVLILGLTVLRSRSTALRRPRGSGDIIQPRAAVQHRGTRNRQ
jgi:hypothetical protein